MTEYSTPTTKKCSNCGEHKPLDAFGPHRNCKYGRASRCRECANAMRRDQYAIDAAYRERKSTYHRTRYVNDIEYRKNVLRNALSWKRADVDRNREKTRKAQARYEAKMRAQIDRADYLASDRYRSHEAVRNAVQRNDFPPARGLVCEICQEAQARHWHHWHGYDEPHQLDVIAVCHECHGKEHSMPWPTPPGT